MYGSVQFAHFFCRLRHFKANRNYVIIFSRPEILYRRIEFWQNHYAKIVPLVGSQDKIFGNYVLSVYMCCACVPMF